MHTPTAPRGTPPIDRWLWLLAPGLLAVVVILFYPFRFAFELDADEGVNLIKSLLVSQGARLYTEVWSDQPPLLTALLAIGFRTLGVNLTAMRLGMLAFSCVLVGAAVHYLRAFWGTPHAIAGGLLLGLLPAYLRLSVSVMVGLPAIALAVVSFLAISYWHRQRRQRWLLLSGLMLGLSVMIKLFTGLLAPLFVLGLVLQDRQEARDPSGWKALLAPAAVWAGGFVLGVLPVGLAFVPAAGLRQLLLNHWLAQATEFPNPESIAEFLAQSLPTIALAVIGTASVIREKRYPGLYLAAWAAAGYLLLTQLSTVWYHHQLLVTVPAAILAGIAVGELLAAGATRFQGLRVASLRGGLLVISGLLIPLLIASILANSITELDYRLPNFVRPQASRREIQALNLLAAMRDYAEATQLIVTDRPMLAIKLGKPVPAEVAALTGKRLLTGEFPESAIIDAIIRHRPEQVALARFELPEVTAYLRQHYRLVHEDTDHRLFIRPDLLEP
jgi:ABC-type sugar transport system permease subunit